MVSVALATGWSPSEVRTLTLGHLEAVGSVLRERKRAQARAAAHKRRGW